MPPPIKVVGVNDQPVACHAGEASDTEDEGSGEEEGQTSHEEIRRDLLLGHVLALAAQGGAVPPHALPALAASLAAAGLLPRWVQVRHCLHPVAASPAPKV